MDEIDRLAIEIAQFFEKSNLLTNLGKKEPELLEAINFLESQPELARIGRSKKKRSKCALFGFGSVKTDYRCGNTVIEVKYTRNNNECDIKNGLSQVIEQAVCYEVSQAILLVIDAGRASHRKWNAVEGKFISMFQQNPFGIKLRVVRIIVNKKKVCYEIV